VERLKQEVWTRTRSEDEIEELVFKQWVRNRIEARRKGTKKTKTKDKVKFMSMVSKKEREGGG
jgi:hypothetical protein